MKKIQLTVLLVLISSNLTFSQNVGIGTETPELSAVLDLESNNKGLLIPRQDSNQRDAILAPANSLLIFNTDTDCYEGYSEFKSKWFPVRCLEDVPATPSLFVCNEEFTDSRDGNEYKTIQIGNQCWMAENLKYLPIIHDNAQFQAKTNSQPGYGVYGYDGSDVTTAKSHANYSTYGVLYNWAAVMQGAASSTANPSGVQGICPDGWHVPSDEEWVEMEIYLGMDALDALNKDDWRNSGNVGEQLKASSADTPSWNGTNTSDFTAFAGGSRLMGGTFSNIGSRGHWWTTLESSGGEAFFRALNSYYVGVACYKIEKAYGFSLCCVLD